MSDKEIPGAERGPVRGPAHGTVFKGAQMPSVSINNPGEMQRRG